MTATASYTLIKLLQSMDRLNNKRKLKTPSLTNSFQRDPGHTNISNHIMIPNPTFITTDHVTNNINHVANSTNHMTSSIDHVTSSTTPVSTSSRQVPSSTNPQPNNPEDSSRTLQNFYFPQGLALRVQVPNQCVCCITSPQPQSLATKP